MITAVLTALYPYKFLILYYIITRALVIFSGLIDVIKISSAFLIFCSSERMEFFNQKKIEIEKNIAITKVYTIFKTTMLCLVLPLLELGTIITLPSLFRLLISDYFDRLQNSLKDEKVKAKIKEITQAKK